ncbi:hypothetical protein BM1_10925 [Bipolaris maydis]|nr:hypothetical protein BM1_10925 [Bipolaris maydis]
MAFYNLPSNDIHEEIHRWISERFCRLEAGADSTGKIELRGIWRIAEHALVSNADARSINLAGLGIMAVDLEGLEPKEYRGYERSEGTMGIPWRNALVITQILRLSLAYNLDQCRV